MEEIWKLIDQFPNYNVSNLGNIKNIYISRRTWLNSDKSNIGTDYTSRRKMINENELVEQLKVGGKLVIPLGEGNIQKMIVLTRTSENSEDVKDYGDFSFVPMLENKVL